MIDSQSVRDAEPMVEATRILAIRHGETDWNVATRIQGQLDIGLNATGRWQAARLAQALAGEDLQAVYSSDLSRAYDTAQAVAAASGVPVIVDSGLRERAFGCFEGSSFDEIAERWPEASMRWRRRDPDFGPPGGEVLRDFYERCVAAAERLAARHPGQHIALVAHGGVMDCLYRAAARLDLKAPRTWKVGNASINRLLFAGGGFGMIGWSSTAHLEDDMSGQAPLDETSDGATAFGASGGGSGSGGSGSSGSSGSSGISGSSGSLRGDAVARSAGLSDAATGATTVGSATSDAAPRP